MEKVVEYLHGGEDAGAVPALAVRLAPLLTSVSPNQHTAIEVTEVHDVGTGCMV